MILSNVNRQQYAYANAERNVFGNIAKARVVYYISKIWPT